MASPSQAMISAEEALPVGLGFVGRAATHPVILVTSVLGSLAAVVATSLVVVVVVFLLLGLEIAAVSRTPAFRRSVADDRRRHAHRKRRERRHALVADVPGAPEELQELTALVDQVGHADGGRTADRLELEDLLDHHARTIAAQEACRRALATVDRGGLERALDQAPPGVRRRILERKLAAYDRCAEDHARLTEERSTIVELVRLIAFRAGRPEVVLENDLAARKVADLDADDAALAEVGT